jgi:Cu-Zn family superoxide dismutase
MIKPVLVKSGTGVFAVLVLSGCVSMSSDGPSAVAMLQPTKGSQTTGTVTFTQVGNKVRVVADVKGLKAGAEHGFHIHEKGDCSSGDGMSTGGHFNPGGKGHAHHSSSERHAGDMPSLLADAQGNAKLSVTLDLLMVAPGATSVVGRGLIVHRDPDDYKTQPTGNAGPRIACAVIAAK